jgi:hypothetical protein
MALECSLPYSQELAACPYTEVHQFSPCSHPASWKYILILSSHLCLGFSSGLQSSIPTNILYAPLLSPFTLYASSILYVMWKPESFWMSSTDH